jgi:hypothetical protein
LTTGAQIIFVAALCDAGNGFAIRGLTHQDVRKVEVKRKVRHRLES